MLSASLLLAVLQQAAASPASDPVVATTIQVPRLTETVRIDGVLDEPAWQRGVRLTGFHQFQPVDSRPAEEETEVRVWYAPNAIYFGITARARDPKSVHATLADRDNIGNDDRITIYLDTFNDRRRAYLFAVNALGVQLDGVRTEGAASAANMFGGSIDYNPDFLFESKGRVTDTGYEVEVRIPFKSLRYSGSGPQQWGLNVVRNSPATGYEDTWTDVRRAGASFLAQAGLLTGIHDLERGVVAEVQPFITATANGALDSTSAGARFRRDDPAASVGANLKLGFTQIAIDATVNPDFSQVESDAGLVTVNERFTLFIPERRPFFLEGIELFATPNQLVYTRRIANPTFGGKVTGKLGAFSVAYLTAWDQRKSTDDALFNVARVRRDLGGSSVMALTATDIERTNGHNRVLAADTRLVFRKLYYFESQLGGSWSRDELIGAPVTRHAPIWKGELDRTGRTWGFNYLLSGIGDEFDAQAGFVPRVGITNTHGFNRFSWYGDRGKFLESITTFFGPSRIWRYAETFKKAPIEGRDDFNLMGRLRGGWGFNSSVSRQAYTLDAARYAAFDVDHGAAGGIQPYVAPERLTNLAELLIGFDSPVFRQVNFGFDTRLRQVAIFDEGAEGRERRFDATVSIRPTAFIRIDGTAAYSRITRARDGSEFARTIIPRVKTEYQVTRALFFRIVGEYQSLRRAALVDAEQGDPLLLGGTPVAARQFGSLRVDWLASYRPTPGTIAFLGYGSTREGALAGGLSELERTTDGFFLKIAYQFRR